MTSAYAGTIGELKSLNHRGVMSEELQREFINQFGQSSLSQIHSWENSISVILDLLFEPEFDNLEVLIELRMPVGDERADLVLLGGNRHALVLELKQWSHVDLDGDSLLVRVPGDPRQQHPSLQALNYQGKLKMLHPIGHQYDWKSAVVLHNMSQSYSEVLELDPALVNGAPLIYRDDLDTFAARCRNWLLSDSPELGAAKKFDEATFEQTTSFFEVIRRYGDQIIRNAAVALAKSGTGLTQEQQLIFSDIMDAVERGESRIFAVSGGPGSGKSLLAVHLLMHALSEDISSILALRNNRLMAILRACFKEVDRSLPDATIYSSVPRSQRGLGDEGFRGTFGLVVCDEAQRFGTNNIAVIMQRAPVTVFFYDETQILNTPEQGTLSNFEHIAQRAGIMVEERSLTAAMRCRGGAAYHLWIEALLAGSQIGDWSWRKSYELLIFDDIRAMRSHLESKRHSSRVALVASFTESPGNNNTPHDHIDNIRIGYPLKSGFELYKDSDVQISWLMDPQKDYKPFWMDGRSNQLDRVSSIYGCQGFESDYVGVVWGRDFVWRTNSWEVGNIDAITDTIERNGSLKQCAQRDPALARQLLQNRYRIFLTRGMLGTCIFCEDAETRDHLFSLLKLGL